MDKGLYHITSELLSLHQIPHTNFYIKQLLGLSMEDSSLLQVRDVMAAYDIEHMLVQIGYEELLEIPANAVLPFQWRNYPLAIFKQASKDQITLGFPGGQEVTLSRNDFLIHWEGQALLIAASPVSEEPYYQTNRQKANASRMQQFLKYLLIGLFAVLALWIFFSQVDALTLQIVLVIKVIGITVALSLLKESRGASSALANRLCQAFGKQASCHDVLQSEQSNILGFGLAELSVSYFLAGTLLLLAVPLTSSSLLTHGLQWLNFLTLPFIFYSLYHQFFSTGWCALCLSVIVVLAGEFMLFQWTDLPLWSFHWNDLLTGLMAISVSFVFLFYLSPITTKALEDRNERKILSSYKRAPEHIGAVLRLRKEHTPFPGQYDFEIGNPDADQQITFIFGAFCEPCKQAYQELKRVMEVLGDHLSIRIVPYLPATSDQTGAGIVQACLALMNESQDKTVRRKAIDELVSMKDINPFTISEWMSLFAPTSRDQDLGPYVRWFEENQITYTPYIMLNNKSLPPEISLEEIKQYLKLEVGE